MENNSVTNRGQVHKLWQLTNLALHKTLRRQSEDSCKGKCAYAHATGGWDVWGSMNYWVSSVASEGHGSLTPTKASGRLARSPGMVGFVRGVARCV